MNELAGKVAVITGGGSGIGRGIASAFGDAGMKLVIADIHEETAVETAAALQARGVDARAVRTDVSDLASVQALADEAYDAFGAVHVLCNNAGVMSWHHADEAEHVEWEWIVSINLWGTIHGVEAFLPRMLAQGGEAHIVNTASIAGVLPSAISSLYSTTKFAIVGLSETLNVELKDTPVGVTVLCPGAVQTRLRETSTSLQPPAMSANEEPAVRRPGLGSGSAALAPEDVGRMVVDGIRHKRRFIFTEPALQQRVEDHFRGILDCFAPTPDGGDR